MSARFNKRIFTQEEAFAYGLGLQEANGHKGRVRVTVPKEEYIVSLVD